MKFEQLLKIYSKNMYVQQELMSPDKIPTGSYMADYLSGGGVPRRKITQFSGHESAGKTSLTLQVAASFQKTLHPEDEQNEVLFIDQESTFEKIYAEGLGIDWDRFKLIGGNNPGDFSFRTGEQIIDFIGDVCTSDNNKFGLIIVDSIPVMIPQYNESISAQEGRGMAGQARMFSENLRSIITPLKISNTALIFTNQIRMNPGAYGNPEYVPGGKALHFLTSLHLGLRTRNPGAGEAKGDLNKGGDEIQGWPQTIKVEKNKTGGMPKGSKLLSFFRYNHGTDLSYELSWAGEITGILMKEKNTYFFHGEKIDGVVGQPQFTKYLKDNPDFTAKLELDVRNAIINNAQQFVEAGKTLADGGRGE